MQIESNCFYISCLWKNMCKYFHHHHYHHSHHLRLTSPVSHSWIASTVFYSAISSVMFNVFTFFSTTLLQVFFGLPPALLPSTSSSIALLSMQFSFLCQPRFPQPIFKILHLTSSSRLFISKPVLLSNSWRVSHHSMITTS